MKKKILIWAAVGAVFLAVAFLAPLIAKMIRGGAYRALFRTLAPLTYTSFIIGILALCVAVMLWLVKDWVDHR